MFREREILFVRKSFQYNKKYLNAPIAFSNNEIKRYLLGQHTNLFMKKKIKVNIWHFFGEREIF